ncbi:glycoside hydrolase family 108 protein [Pseudoduganella sp. R-34]|uniref:glycoside hydrolase family 108 protein n=1 Tax=Pseudoduganella sp. R-34 TaxID=3404062 RepID=UPI003CE68247
MADFQKFLPTLLSLEGGFSNDPHDPGGVTNMGITFPIYKQHALRLLGVQPTLDGLKSLTAEQAGKIYKVEYWDRMFGDEISFEPLANIMFDFYVNAGHHAFQLLQQVLNAAGGQFDLRAPLRSQTVEALRHHDIIEVYTAYKDGRKAYYRALAHEHPVLRRYLKGWLHRVDRFPDFQPQGKGCDPMGNTQAGAGKAN